VKVDLARRTVEVDGRPVQLTYVEFELLRTLAANPGVVFSRQRLLEALWGGSEYREPRTIDVHVRHLREKLEADPSDPRYLQTVRGAGYRFSAE
jgi:DNA-binding response OmpR family regulator